MSTVFEAKPQAGQNLAEMTHKLEFQKRLQAVTNKIHATSNIDEIMLELSQDICSLFEAERLTIYVLSEDRTSIISKVKTGLSSFKDLKLPINEQSIAGFVALSKKLINIRDVYDDNELRTHNPNLKFLKEVDKRTGFRTKQMLVAPVLDSGAAELIGVIQVINSKSGQSFSIIAEEGAAHLCETLEIALRQRSRPAAVLRGKYDHLVTNAVLSVEEMELATRSARRKNLDIEDVLIDEFQVKPPAIGEALSQFFKVPYEPFRPDRVKPLDLLKNLKRDYVQSSLWIPIEDVKEGLIVLTADPEKVRASKVVSNIFPKHKVVFKVCTHREFAATLDQFFGAESGDTSSIGELLSTMDEEGDEEGAGGSDDASLAQDNELVKLVNKIIVDAYHQGASDIHIEPYPARARPRCASAKTEHCTTTYPCRRAIETRLPRA